MMLFIRASLLSSYGKNIAKPRYDQKKDQCAKYCHAPLNIRIHLVFWWISPKRHFATLTLKFLLNPITKETMTNLQNTVKRRGIIVVRKCFALSVKFLPNAILARNMANLQNTLTGLLFTVFRWSICACHVSNILESLL